MDSMQQVPRTWMLGPGQDFWEFQAFAVPSGNEALGCSSSHKPLIRKPTWFLELLINATQVGSIPILTYYPD